MDKVNRSMKILSTSFCYIQQDLKTTRLNVFVLLLPKRHTPLSDIIVSTLNRKSLPVFTAVCIVLMLHLNISCYCC